MVELSYPFDAGAGSGVPDEAAWSNMLRSAWSGGDGVIRALDRTYDLNRLECYADSTGMRVKVKSGRAQLRGFHYVSDAEVTLTIAAAHATLGRIDRVVLHLDTTANTIALEVMTGTASGSPVAPTITDTATQFRLPLATVLVDAAVSTIAAGKVTRMEPPLVSGFTPAAILLRATAQTIPHNALTSISFTTISRDTDGGGGAGGYGVKTVGWYDLSACVLWSAAQLTGTRQINLAVNRAAGGSSNVVQDERQANGSSTTAQVIGTQEYLNIGDSVQVNVYHTNTAVAALDVTGASPTSPRLTVVWRGP